MPLNRNNCRTFHRTLYGQILQKVRLLKRNDDQQESTVRSITLYQCRQSLVTKTGEPIQGEMTSDHRTVWLIPRVELDRTGVNYINMIDAIVDKFNRWWQPESPVIIEEKLFGQYVSVQCLRIDPNPNLVVKTG